jgi:hypothetical protein
MRNGSKGGMQTASTNAKPFMYCPKCGKLAARIDIIDGIRKYMHFTKKGTVWHEIKQD